MVKYLIILLALASLSFAEGQWVVQDNPFNGNDSIVFSDVHAMDSLHCWVIGYHTWDGLWVLRTLDGGKNWEAKGPFAPQARSVQMRLNDMRGPAIKFVDLLQGYFVWGPWVYHTTDGGNNWKNVATIENEVEPLTDIEFVDPVRGWTVDNPYSSKRGCIYHSDDGGKTWAIQDSADPTIGFFGICFINFLKGFVVGQSGTLLRTTDGGSHWTKIATGTTKDLMDVQFADSLHGIATGEMDFWTKDGGEVWTEGSGGGGMLLFLTVATHGNYSGFLQMAV